MGEAGAADRKAVGPACFPLDTRRLDRDDIIAVVESYFGRVRKLGGDTGECSSASLADFLLYRANTDNFDPAIAVSATLSSDEFMLALADELFGSFLQPTGIMFPEKEFRCCACEIVVPVRDWILAPHKQGCIVARARDYLVKHKPQSVPGWPAHDDISNGGQ